MSKSKKNTIDPENIIANYGADAARLFILSDSPPEKDVLWSEEGISSSFKFMQKLWTLNSKIIEKIKENCTRDDDSEITKFTNRFIKEVTNNLENFSYNKIIANLHEMHSFINKKLRKNYKRETLIDNYKKILTLIQPIIPHFSNECLEIINVKNINWPKYDDDFLKEELINLVIQINGKKRGLIKTKRDQTENEIMNLIKKDEKIMKYFQNNEIKKNIYIKNKLINIII